MNKRTSAAITGACLGIAAGSAAYMMRGTGKSTDMKRRKKLLKRGTGKALRQVSNFIDSVSYMMK